MVSPLAALGENACAAIASALQLDCKSFLSGASREFIFALKGMRKQQKVRGDNDIFKLKM